jgi:hypothetical protein
MQGHPVVAVGGAGRCATPAHSFQSPDSAAPSVGEKDVAVSKTKLSRVLLL